MTLDAEKQFWCRPDLVAELLPFLDSDATISLAQLANLNTAHGRALWNKLSRRYVCVRREESTSPDNWDQEKKFVQAKILVMDLVKILKMKEEASSLQLDFLNFICERFSASQNPSSDFVEIRSSSPLCTFHTVSPLGFLLMEAAEGALGSTNLTLDSVVVANLDDHLISAVASRLSRQLQQGLGVKLGTRVDIGQNIVVKSQEGAEALSTLLHHCQIVNVHGCLRIDGDIEAAGWEALRRGLSWGRLNPGQLDAGFRWYMLPATREDLRAIWQCLSHTCWFVLSHGKVKAFERERGEDGWKALEELLDLGDLEGRARQAEAISGQERGRRQRRGEPRVAQAVQQQLVVYHLLRAPQRLWDRMRRKVEKMKRRTRTTEINAK